MIKHYTTLFIQTQKKETIANESDDVFESIFTTIILNISKSLEQGSGWITDSVIDRNINISKYNLLDDSSYIKLPKELDQPKKRLINIQNINDNECFKWYLVRYLDPADHRLSKIVKTDKDFAKEIHFKDIRFLPKLSFYKIEKNNCSILALLVMKTK